MICACFIKYRIKQQNFWILFKGAFSLKFILAGRRLSAPYSWKIAVVAPLFSCQIFKGKKHPEETHGLLGETPSSKTGLHKTAISLCQGKMPGDKDEMRAGGKSGGDA